MGMLEPGVQVRAAHHRLGGLATSAWQRELPLQVDLPGAGARRRQVTGAERTRPERGAGDTEHTGHPGHARAFVADGTRRAARSRIEGTTSQHVDALRHHVAESLARLLRAHVEQESIRCIEHADFAHANALRRARLRRGGWPALAPETALLLHDGVGSDPRINGEVRRLAAARARLLPGEDVVLALGTVSTHMQQSPCGPLDAHVGLVHGEELADDGLVCELIGVTQARDRNEIALQRLPGDSAGRLGHISRRGGAHLIERDLGIGARGEDGVGRIARQTERKGVEGGIGRAHRGVAIDLQGRARLDGDLRRALPALLTTHVSGTHADESVTDDHAPGRSPRWNLDLRHPCTSSSRMSSRSPAGAAAGTASRCTSPRSRRAASLSGLPGLGAALRCAGHTDWKSQ